MDEVAEHRVAPLGVVPGVQDERVPDFVDLPGHAVLGVGILLAHREVAHELLGVEPSVRLRQLELEGIALENVGRKDGQSLVDPVDHRQGGRGHECCEHCCHLFLLGSDLYMINYLSI